MQETGVPIQAADTLAEEPDRQKTSSVSEFLHWITRSVQMIS